MFQLVFLLKSDLKKAAITYLKIYNSVKVNVQFYQ